MSKGEGPCIEGRYIYIYTKGARNAAVKEGILLNILFLMDHEALKECPRTIF